MIVSATNAKVLMDGGVMITARCKVRARDAVGTGVKGLRVWNWALAAFGVVLAITGCVTSRPDLVSGPDLVPDTVIHLDTGDVLQIMFPGATNLNTTVTIRRDGNITLPFVGEYKAVGKAPDAVQRELAKLYEPQLQIKEVVVSLASSYTTVYVGGAVLRPGKITSQRPMTVLEAIMEAGGFDENKANKRKVAVIRHQNGIRLRYVLDLKEVLQGNARKSFYVKPYDVVYVPDRVQMF